MPDLPIPLPAPDRVTDAAANLYDKVLRGGVADLRPTPRRIIDEAPHRTLFRYLADDGAGRRRELPVLLVPPLAAPVSCFDLRRGCSLAAHLLSAGHPTYLLDFGAIALSDRDLGLEHWVTEVVPAAIRRTSQDAGGRPVQVVSWSLGGIMSLLAAADDDLPVASVSAFGSPFDFARVRIVAPIRPLANLTNGMLGTALIRALGTAPAPLVKRAFQLSSIDKHLTKPVALALNLHDREFLAQVEAVEAFTDGMHAYPGRSIAQLYHRFFRVNELAGGRTRLGDRTIDLADVRVPVLSIAGSADVLAPREAVHHVAELLVNSPGVRLETGPGGHLGILTGRTARDTTWRWLCEFLAAQEPTAAGRRHLRVVA